MPERVRRSRSISTILFYDPWDTTPKFSYDPTGVATGGRYIVRFGGYWEQMVGMGRADAEISLVELA